VAPMPWISTLMIAPPLLLSKREGRARQALYEATCKIGNTGRHCAKRVPVPSACLIVLDSPSRPDRPSKSNADGR
jgi:hypothetical protein